jgi:MFS family permease
LSADGSALHAPSSVPHFKDYQLAAYSRPGQDNPGDLYDVMKHPDAALTAFLTMAAIGVLAGGWLADRTQRHGDVAAIGFGLTAVIVLLIAVLSLPTLAVVLAMGLAGFLSGMIMPSRDMLVRAAAPPGMTGRVFGIVTTGFNIGGTIGPMLGGWLMDHGEPRWIFYSSVCFMTLTVLAVLVGDRRSRRRTQGMALAQAE